MIHTATFEGIVHGVVVHIINDISSGSSLLNKPFTVSKEESSTLKATSIAFDVLSIYSTSASAKDDPLSWHQWTGFSPFSRYPSL